MKKKKTIPEWLETDTAVPFVDSLIAGWLRDHPKYEPIGKTRRQILEDIIGDMEILNG